jgi:oxygen-dependent protoporphyrinogen oxidase
MFVIVGAGISGLVLGYYLQKHKIPYLIIEKNATAGGNIQTIFVEGKILELGPNTLLLKSHIWELIQELHLQNEVVFASKSAKKRYILKENYYKALPTHPLSLLSNTFFSLATKMKILRDFFKKPNKDIPDNESVHDFFVRHFGTEIAELVVNPFVSGIYAGDSKKLITKYAFSTLTEAEKNSGSIIKGFIKYQKEHRSQGIISFKSGMSTLVQALYEAQHQNILLNTIIQKTEFDTNNHNIYLASGEKLTAQKIIFTSPAYVTAKYIQPLSASFAQQLESIHYSPVCVVHSVYPKNKVKHKLDGFGTLHPKKYNTFTLGTIFNSTLFNNRTNSDEILLTTFIGGQKFLPLSEQEIKLNTHSELSKYLGIEAEPVYTHVHIWQKAIPQYEANYADILPYTHSWEKQGIFLSGNWLNGISVEKCIAFNAKLAQKLASLG